jgi:ribokinase
MIPGRIGVIGILTQDHFFRAGRLPAAGETVIGDGYDRSPGGKGSNQAAAAALLGADVWMIAAIGDDSGGREGLAALEASGVKTTECLIRPEAATAAAGIAVGSGGANQIVVCPGAAETLTPLECREALERIDPEWVLIQNEAPAETRRAAIGRRILYNPAPALPLDLELLAECEAICPNEIEAGQLLGRTVRSPEEAWTACGHLIGMGVRTALITLGRQGSVWRNGSEGGWTPALSSKALDTTAAGDCFFGALASSLARGDSWELASRWASAAAGLSVRKPGAMHSLPGHEETVCAVKELPDSTRFGA